ncbi:MAG: hypothetical protein LUD39_02530 [Opitutae bacterium]|nr:hypothetical protein [Opitutae bacterium]
MADEKNSPNRQVISLQAISQNFLGALQRQFDLLAFNLAATQSIEEEKYSSMCSLTHAMPVANAHMPFDAMKTYAHGLIMRQALNDTLSLAAACMDNCHLLCTLIANKAAMEANPKETNELVGKKQNAFVHSAIQDKFEVFEKDFNITSSLEDAITTLAIALRILVQRNGVVSAEDVDEDGELVFEFKTVQIIKSPAPDGKPEIRLADTRRAFKIGDTIDLTNSEILSLNITTADFFHRLFKAVDSFGAKILGKDGGSNEGK